MVNEPGSIPSLYVASTRDVVPFPTGVPSRKRAVVENTQHASAGHSDRPGFSAFIAKIRSSAEQRAELAAQVRQFQNGTQQADELLARIKEQLVRIVKQYPPFAHDDPQRLAYLNAITGLRKQLDALTFPPERQLRETFSNQAEVRMAVPSVPAIPIRNDLAMPDLDPINATDADIETALAAIEKAQNTLQDMRGSMWQDVVRFIGEANLGRSGDDQAQAKAGEVRGYVASNTTRGIGLSMNTILSIGL